MEFNKELVLARIKKIFDSYEDKKDITYICLSKKLYRFLSSPATIHNLLPIVDNNLYKYAFFFSTTEDYILPAQVHAIDFKPVSTVALKVTRTAKSLADEVEYHTEIARGTTMNELAFLISNIIREMNDAGYCKKEDMLKNIGKYLET